MERHECDCRKGEDAMGLIESIIGFNPNLNSDEILLVYKILLF